VIISVTVNIAARGAELDVACFEWVLGATLGVLLASAGAALLGVLLPQQLLELTVGELDAFLTPQFYAAQPPDVQSRAVKASAALLAHNRAINARKARFLQVSVILLVCGLVGISAFGVMIVLDG
jgi:hypothetical protein